MAVSSRSFAGFIFTVSAVVLGAALLSQYWGGLAPCELCLKERWSWDGALAIAAIAFAMPGAMSARIGLRAVALVLALVFAAGAALAFYHVGVEQHWFAGPSSCTADAIGAQTVEELRRQILGTAPVICDQVQWSLFGVSLAGWNLVASLLMAGACVAASRRGA